jgi:hypothetical protein
MSASLNVQQSVGQIMETTNFQIQVSLSTSQDIHNDGQLFLNLELFVFQQVHYPQA